MNKCEPVSKRNGVWFKCTSEEPEDCTFNVSKPNQCPFKVKTARSVLCGCHEANLRSCEVR